MDTYQVRPIELEDVQTIETWTYPGYMKSIYMKPYYDHYNKETKQTYGPGGCDGYAVERNKQLFGLFECSFDQGILEIGLAIHPKFTNKGLSKSYIEACIKFAIKHYRYQKPYLQLQVNKHNIQAIKAYQKANFVQVKDQGESYLMQYKIKGAK
jgi:ribosomal-protein-alanine N-acetyltransferase